MTRTRLRAAAAFLLAVLVTPARADLVGLYRFEDASNLGKDSSTKSNDLMPFGGASVDPNGKYGQGLALDGLNGVLGLPDGYGGIDDNRLPNGFPFDKSAYTLAAWVNSSVLVNQSSSQMGIIGWGFYGNGGRVIALRLKNDGNPTGTGIRHYWWSDDLDVNGINLSDGTFHHIAATFDPGTGVRTIYIDGTSVTSDIPGLPNNPAASFRIGRTCDFCGGGEFFQGTLDDVAVFNESLGGDEIVKIMSGDFSDFGVPPH